MNEVVDDDLPAFRVGAQACGLNDRLTEIVAFLRSGLADAHANPYSQLLLGATVAHLDGLLHLGRARK